MPSLKSVVPEREKMSRSTAFLGTLWAHCAQTEARQGKLSTPSQTQHWTVIAECLPFTWVTQGQYSARVYGKKSFQHFYMVVTPWFFGFVHHRVFHYNRCIITAKMFYIYLSSTSICIMGMAHSPILPTLLCPSATEATHATECPGSLQVKI